MSHRDQSFLTVPQEIRQTYLYGKCMWLALALQELYHWKLKVQKTPDGRIDHVFVTTPDGVEVDIDGPQKKVARTYPARAISQAGLFALLDKNEGRLRPMNAYERYKQERPAAMKVIAEHLRPRLLAAKAITPNQGQSVFVNEWLWNTYGDGRLRRFDELPLTHQKALAFESLEFPWYGDLKETERRYEHGFEDYSGKAVRFKVFRVPSSVMTSAIWNTSDELQGDHDSWKDYHDWYVRDQLRGKEIKVRTEDWPVLLHDFYAYEPLLWDGWHRLHTYLKLKREDIPCLLPVWP